MYKVICCSLLILVAVYADDHSIIDCDNPGTKPNQIFNQPVSKTGEFLKYREEVLRIPTNGFAETPIVCIFVLNQGTEADGGYPKIVAGGVGENYVALNLKSQLGKGYDFKVTVSTTPELPSTTNNPTLFV